MAHTHGLSPEEQRKEDVSVAIKGFIILLIVTFLEVGVALVGNGHIIEGFMFPKVIMVPLMIVLSLYKAYYIVSIFMHLGYETKGMAASVVLPTLLLVWAIIAFLWEGEAWRNSRHDLERHHNNGSTKTESKEVKGEETGSLLQPVEELSTAIRLG